MNIELRIDHLVLDGLTGDPRGIIAALHAELTRLRTMTPASAWRESRLVPGISSPEIRSAQSPAELGMAIARSVHSGVKGRRSAVSR